MNSRISARILALVAFAVAGGPADAWARPKHERGSSPQVCAVLEKSSGITQVVDDSRLNIVDLQEKTAIPCGSWVSVESGWSQLRHRDGYLFHLNEGTYVQFPLQQGDAEPVVLYRGEMFGQADGGTGELRVLTPNARIRVRRGSVIASFDQEEQRTQVVSVDGVSTIENRFETSRATPVKAGRFSSLDFKLLRVIPAPPKPIATVSLKAKLKALHVPEQEKERAIAFARKSREEAFSPSLEPVPYEPEPSEAARAVRRQGRRKGAKEVFAATEGDTPDEYLLEHLAGDEDLPRPMPQHRSRKSKRAPASVSARHGPASDGRVSVRSDGEDPPSDGAADAERKRLIEDLSKIHTDE